ncbi:MAG TPA: uroporphyrinogen-III synthase [bacterium]|nr:uroporphyrinogen-III synthase [bacterium]
MLDLQHKTILVTRPRNKAAGMAALIEKYHGTPIIFPTIEIAPPAAWEHVDDVIANIRQYDWVIFTSAHGVKFFIERLQTQFTLGLMDSVSIAAVGSKTAKSLRNRGLSVEFLPEQFTAASLLDGLNQKHPESQAFLLVSGDKGGETLTDGLQSAGASVEKVVVYRNIQPDPENVRDIIAELRQNAIDVLTFTSPSTFNNFITILGEVTDDVAALVHSAPIAVIGPVTAGAVEESGFRAAVIPENSTIEDMMIQIGKYIQQQTQSAESSST